jgi:hypothetical protein
MRVSITDPKNPESQNPRSPKFKLGPKFQKSKIQNGTRDLAGKTRHGTAGRKCMRGSRIQPVGNLHGIDQTAWGQPTPWGVPPQQDRSLHRAFRGPKII